VLPSHPSRIRDVADLACGYLRRKVAAGDRGLFADAIRDGEFELRKNHLTADGKTPMPGLAGLS
jgi:hypothetical protein